MALVGDRAAPLFEVRRVFWLGWDSFGAGMCGVAWQLDVGDFELGDGS